MSQEAPASSGTQAGLIELRDVSMRFRYESVLRNINLTIQQGQTVCIIGESGCGKTVMLKLIIGLLRPTAGKVFFRRRRCRESRWQAAREDAAAVWVSLPDGRALRQPDGLRQRSVRPARASHLRRGAGAADRLAAAEEVGLPAEIETRKPAELSGGQRKRVGLARALAIGPEVMLYDEPTTGLDPIMSDVINELILQTQRSMKTTGVVVTHDMKTVTKVADRVVMLYPLARLGPDEPQILYDGPANEIEQLPRPAGRPVCPRRGRRTASRDGLLRTAPSSGRRVQASR